MLIYFNSVGICDWWFVACGGWILICCLVIAFRLFVFLLCCHCRVFVGMVVLVSFPAACMVLVDCCCWLFGFGIIGYCGLLVC